MFVCLLSLKCEKWQNSDRKETEKSFAHEHCKAANFLYFLTTYFGDKFVHVLNPCIVEHIALEVQFYPWVPYF